MHEFLSITECSIALLDMWQILLYGFEILLIVLAACFCKTPARLSLVALLAALAIGFLEAVRGSALHLNQLTYDSAEITGRNTMRAAVFAWDGDEVKWEMATVPIPHHSDLSALIRVKAVAVNPSNFKHPMMPIAWPFLRHLRVWPVGYDVAGEVMSAGSSRFCDIKRSDNVWGMSLGVAAEYAVVPCSMAVPVPAQLSHAEAAGLGVAGLTSLLAYERNPIKAGQSVLVVGASGGCGQFGVALAGAMGAQVTGICSSRNVEFVRQLSPGLGTIVDYKNSSAMESMKSHGPQFDLIYDTVSSNAPEDPDYEPVLGPLLKPQGTYITIGPCTNDVDQLRGMMDAVSRPLGIHVQRPGYDWFLLSPSKSLMLRLNAFFESGALSKVAIDSVYDLAKSEEAIHQAMQRQKSRRAVGKIILTFGEGN